MELDDIRISRAIIDTYMKKLLDSLELDVAIVGGGPSGITCGYYLARLGIKTAMFERKLSIGGGMWGGGMMFNEIVVQRDARSILEEFGIHNREYSDGYYTADSVEAISTLISGAARAGLRIFNCISVEDVVIREKCIQGLVLNWSAIDIAGLHIDPLTVRAAVTVDATGHAAEVCRILERKTGPVLKTPTGKIIGERSMWAEKGEPFIVKNTKEVYSGLWVCGMAAGAVFGGPRMGPIFGGMLLSGKKAAENIAAYIRKAGAKSRAV